MCEIPRDRLNSRPEDRSGQLGDMSALKATIIGTDAVLVCLAPQWEVEEERRADAAERADDH